ncbi:MAG: YhbY family RNA-binding protein [Acidiferrobacterales bacterium]
MILTGKQRGHLRALAHHRDPVVTLGAGGLTPAVIAEIEQALDHHELVKVRFVAGDRAKRHALFERICALTAAEPIQEIGRVGVIFRPGLKLPRRLR